jgi:cytochrome c biogenesis protein CcmG, thiol:disulfide interchange protein DsbE
MSTPATPRARNSQVAKAAKAGSGGSRNVWIIASVVAVIVFAAIIAVALSQESDEPDSTTGATAAVTVTGDSLTSYIDDPEGSIGDPAPELSGTSIEGEPLTIENDGRAKLVGFFAHWCPHCQREVPVLVDWIEQGNDPDDVDIYAVSTDVRPASGNYPPSAWFEEEGLDLPILKDDAGGAAHGAFGRGGFPYWVVVDADGNVVARQSGESTPEELTAMVELARTGAS